MIRASLISLVLLCFSSIGFSQTNVAAAGGVLHLNNNKIQMDDATLIVPRMGDGLIELSFAGHNYVTENFFSRKVNGRVVFYVVFSNENCDGSVEKMSMMGTYVRGNNVAVYYGDIFKKTYSATAVKTPLSLDGIRDLFKKANWWGGFYFEAPVPPPADAPVADETAQCEESSIDTTTMIKSLNIDDQEGEEDTKELVGEASTNCDSWRHKILSCICEKVKNSWQVRLLKNVKNSFDQHLAELSNILTKAKEESASDCAQGNSCQDHGEAEGHFCLAEFFGKIIQIWSQLHDQKDHECPKS